MSYRRLFARPVAPASHGGAACGGRPLLRAERGRARRPAFGASGGGDRIARGEGIDLAVGICVQQAEQDVAETIPGPISDPSPEGRRHPAPAILQLDRLAVAATKPLIRPMRISLRARAAAGGRRQRRPTRRAQPALILVDQARELVGPAGSTDVSPAVLFRCVGLGSHRAHPLGWWRAGGPRPMRRVYVAATHLSTCADPHTLRRTLCGCRGQNRTQETA